ncbi:PREDICTED: serotransferrin-like [Hipposideros armiger]|uniref:Serotransferrin-like n=1 Tax=Hipposideros armiger TaxID=186990 RepID=A0A8B7S9Y7_HIPAR|nr:PREDICTED: serotransferrin-like [Hipposideros armiger]
MRLAVRALLACAVLGLCLAVPEKTVRWCTVSNQEASKCASFRDSMKKVLPETGPLVACVKRTSHLECIKAIAVSHCSLKESGRRSKLCHALVVLEQSCAHVQEAGQSPKDNPETHYYAVAVVKKGSNFQLNELQGKKSCHTGLHRSSGWNVAIGTLYWQLPEPRDPVEKAVANFFAGSCVPCADQTAFPKLCQLCAGQGTDKCACSNSEPYFGPSGAVKCLKDGAGDVAFVKHSAVLENLAQQADQYELLCTDNTRKPVDKYEECHLSTVPSNAVVARTVGGKEDLIWELLKQAQEHYGRGKSADFQLFSSPHGKDLLFEDSAQGLLEIPSKIDSWMYLGYEYVTATRNLREETRLDTAKDVCKKVKWCAIGHHERAKCDEWSVNSKGIIECETAESTEDCIAKIMKGEADAMSLDGGFIYIAGKCGLVPVLAENYKIDPDCTNTPEKGYFAVAVAKKSNEDINWNSLMGKKSCHTGVDRTAGWNIPMGLLYNRINHCQFDKIFSEGCAPGYDRSSSLCALCAGSASGPGKECEPNNHERYYGYTGAFRCLVEKGDVAFVKDQTVIQNTEGNNPDDWAKHLKKDDFQLLCLDGTRQPVGKAATCHLARAPNHAVVSREDKAACVRQTLRDQQMAYGKNGTVCLGHFCMFQSKTKDLLFRDDTKCLAELQERTTYDSYLGAEYVTAVRNLKQCSTSKLLEACTFLGI